jgi:hypothetical protein
VIHKRVQRPRSRLAAIKRKGVLTCTGPPFGRLWGRHSGIKQHFRLLSVIQAALNQRRPSLHSRPPNSCHAQLRSSRFRRGRGDVRFPRCWIRIWLLLHSRLQGRVLETVNFQKMRNGRVDREGKRWQSQFFEHGEMVRAAKELVVCWNEQMK